MVGVLQKWVMSRAALTGLVLGAMWGVAARAYMRLITDDPHFSWVGTVFIIGLAALWGLSLGVIRGARLSGRRYWWRVAFLPSLLLFFGPGIFFLPGHVVGGFALSGRGPRWVRVACGAVGFGAGAIALVLLESDSDETGEGLLANAVVGMVVLSVALALWSREMYRRWPARAKRASVAEQPVPVS